MAFPKNTASRNSDGWHLCRQDFIQLLWLSQSKNANQQMSPHPPFGCQSYHPASCGEAWHVERPFSFLSLLMLSFCLFPLASSYYNITCTTPMNASS